MDDCPFCEIVTGDREAHVLSETEHTLAFFDSNPATPGHTLVVPRQHREFLFAADEETAMATFRTARTVVGAMNRTIDPAGVSLFYTSGELVGEVTHAHVHVVPRYRGDDVQLALPREPLGDDAAQRAERLRAHMPPSDGGPSSS